MQILFLCSASLIKQKCIYRDGISRTVRAEQRSSKTFVLNGMRLICPHIDPLSLWVSSALTHNLRLHPQKHTTVWYRSFSFTALLHQIPMLRFNPNSSESPTLLIMPRSYCYQIITRQLQLFMMYLFNCNKWHEFSCRRPFVRARVCPSIVFFLLFFHMCLDLRHFLCVVILGWYSDSWLLANNVFPLQSFISVQLFHLS